MEALIRNVGSIKYPYLIFMSSFLMLCYFEGTEKDWRLHIPDATQDFQASVGNKRPQRSKLSARGKLSNYHIGISNKYVILIII